jgi:lipopolysaccharide/colanic/teichoic acid biosynthesis glycosyltransferase
MRGGRRPDPKELVPLDHPEITAVGRLLRRFKIDELPQLVNVLRGEMSLIGPRPTLPDQAEAYDDFRRQRLLVRPGVTGLAQVNGNTAVPWDERILFDIAYVRRCSLLMDVGILIRTVWVVVAGEQRTTRPFHTTRYTRYVSPPNGYGTLNGTPRTHGS